MAKWRKDFGHQKRKPHLAIEGVDTSRIDDADLKRLAESADHTGFDGRPVIPDQCREQKEAELEHEKRQEEYPDEQ